MVWIIIPIVFLVAGVAMAGAEPGALTRAGQSVPDWLLILLFLLVAGLIVWRLGDLISKAVERYQFNMSQPLLAVSARVVVKRFEVSGDWHNDWPVPSLNRQPYLSTKTRYYVTFELEDGERVAYSVSGSEYGMLTEGDQGTLSRQGSWYKGFVRRPKPAA